MTPSAVHPWAAEATDRVRFGIETIPNVPWPVLRGFAQAVDDLGFDSLWLPDHPMATGSATWTHLIALAQVTRRVRLGPLVACVAYANPAVTARAAADLDAISNGRAVLGLGSGDAPWEFGQLGITWEPARERQARLEEALRIIHPLLRGETVTFTGERYRVEGAVLAPAPVQQPHVPILVAGGGEQTTLRFAARYADAANLGAVSWAGGAFTPDDLRHKLAVLDGHLGDAERPSEAVLRSGLLVAFLAEDAEAAQAKFAGLPPELAAFFEHLPVVGTAEAALPRVRAMLEAGMRYVIFIVMPGDEETLRLLAEQVLPAVV